MLSALDDPHPTARWITAGADDYVPKPFKPVVLRARIESSLLKKKRYDQEQAKSEALLLGILPAPVAARLKAGERDIVDLVPAATVRLADIVGFTNIAATITPNETVVLPNELFSAFDRLVEAHGLEKIKTIGDADMAVAGVPEPVADYTRRGARMALAMQEAVKEFNEENAWDWSIRIGAHCGPLMAGIIGSRKFA
jgi:adenylate cyclase